MEARMDVYKLLPGAFNAMMGLQTFVNESGLDKTLTELIKIRASQINGCAFCLNMHTREARQMGETEQRIYALPAWAESPYYTEKERAALALTEAVTLISTSRVPDEVYKAAQAVFTQQEIATITMAIVAINSWNRIAITSRTLPQD
ncbi:carboxymuconolactone decarboxylase family protein [Chitinophaga sp. ARDCPP14]|uniref:carboxymuconolactone decarboxylase family protein n=1 Tax=Chitinophaga sp. ARDCPP14 TaxID=3391139 RepID=UPI003F52749E